MGMATSKVRLNICGSSYVVNTSESEDYMQNLADRLNLDMNELMSSSNTVSITTAAVMTALSYRDELEKASGSADNMRRQIKNYLEDMKALNLQNRTFAIVENGSWACKSGDLMQKFLDEEMKNMTVLNERVSLSSALSSEKEAELDFIADAIADSVKSASEA